MHKSATKCNETVGKWCKNKQGASKIIDTLETYQWAMMGATPSGKSTWQPTLLITPLMEDINFP
jgi:hypothetical protein